MCDDLAGITEALNGGVVTAVQRQEETAWEACEAS
jgi:hypothetical protein